jgi:hypothetical protein
MPALEGEVGILAREAREACYLCGACERVTPDRVPASWVYTQPGEPADWPTAPLCEQCRDGRASADEALRSFVVDRLGATGVAADVSWLDAPPRLVRDGIDKLVRGLHRVLHGESAPAATTVVSGGALTLGGPIEVFEFGGDFRVEHVAHRLHHRWRITYFGAVTFHVVICPPLHDALQSVSS